MMVADGLATLEAGVSASAALTYFSQILPNSVPEGSSYVTPMT